MKWLKKFQENTSNWAFARGIIQHSTVHGQLAKGITEAGEVVDAVLKGDRPGMVDGIGDTLVCISIACAMQGEEVPYSKVNTEEGSKLQLAIELSGEISSAAYFAYASHEAGDKASAGLVRIHLAKAVDLLHALAPLVGPTNTLERCANTAWEVIRHRKGHLTPEGVFVKEE